MGKQKNNVLKTLMIIGGILLVVIGAVLIAALDLPTARSYRVFILLIAMGGGLLWKAFVGFDDKEEPADSTDAQAAADAPTDATSANAATPPPLPAAAAKPTRKRGGVMKVISWIIGIVIAIVVLLCVIGWLAGDENADDEAVAQVEYNENRPGYLIGGSDDHIFAIPVEMTSGLKIKSEQVYSYTPGVEEPITYTVENSGPGAYYLRAEGNPGVWGAQTLSLKCVKDKEDGGVIFKGTFTDTDGSESDVELVIHQPGENDDIYLAMIGEYESVFFITSDGDNVSGGFVSEANPDDFQDFNVAMVGVDEYEDPMFTFSGKNFTMRVTWWSSGGESGFAGQYSGPDGKLPVKAYSIY